MTKSLVIVLFDDDKRCKLTSETRLLFTFGGSSGRFDTKEIDHHHHPDLIDETLFFSRNVLALLLHPPVFRSAGWAGGGKIMKIR